MTYVNHDLTSYASFKNVKYVKLCKVIQNISRNNMMKIKL